MIISNIFCIQLQLLVAVFIIAVPNVVLAFSKTTTTSTSTKITTKTTKPDDVVRLWNSGVCPFAQRSWIALLEKDIPFEHCIIDLSNKPDEFVTKYNQAIGSYGSAKVPLLEHNNNLIIESENVVRYIAENVHLPNNFNNEMYPSSSSLKEEGEDQMSNSNTCNRIDLFIESWHTIVDTYYDILTATKQSDVDNAVLMFRNALSDIDNKLFRSYNDQTRNNPNFVLDGGNFYLGNTFSIVECIAAPWVQRFFVTLPYYRNININDDILSSYEYVSRWMTDICNRPSVIQSKCPEEEMLNAATRYYVSYVTPGSPSDVYSSNKSRGFKK